MILLSISLFFACYRYCGAPQSAVYCNKKPQKIRCRSPVGQRIFSLVCDVHVFGFVRRGLKCFGHLPSVGVLLDKLQSRVDRAAQKRRTSFRIQPFSRHPYMFSPQHIGSFSPLPRRPGEKQKRRAGQSLHSVRNCVLCNTAQTHDSKAVLARSAGMSYNTCAVRP